MALFHLNVSSIGKSSGSSACASAAYRSCSAITQTIKDPQTGIEISYIHDFSNKKGLAFSKVFAPEGADGWCLNRQELWNKVEIREAHIRGRYARDIKLALQKEFTLEQNIQILSEYVKDTFVRDGIIADVNIHMDDTNNPHAHIMLTTRKLEMNDNDEWVFGNKNRLLDSKGWLVQIRNNWSDINNKYFMIHDIDQSISHESYEDRGLGFIKSTIHEGAAKHTENQDIALERPEYNRDIVNQNLEYIKSNPSEVIQALAQNASNALGAFGRKDLYKAIDVLLNEIATRGNEAQILVDEARVSLLSKCGEIFQEVDSYDLSSDLGQQNIGLNSSKIDSNNYQDNLYASLDPQLREDVVAIIERFFSRNEKKININEELEYIKENSAKFVKEISSKAAVFTKNDLVKALNNHIDKAILQNMDATADSVDHELLSSTKAKISKEYDGILFGLMKSSELVKLIDNDIGGKEVYTTKGQLSLEKEFTSNIEALSESNQHALNLNELSQEKLSISKKITNKINNGLANILTPEASSWLEKTFDALIGGSKKIVLSDQQSKAVLALVNGKDLAVLSGMPGTGKSTVMAKLVEEYTNHGYEVVGGATSAVASLNLATEANIKAYTLSKWQHDWNGREELEAAGEEVKKLLPKLSSKNVMIVDEMSMVDLKMFNYITSKVAEAGAKLIVLGDNNQFSAIGIGGASERIVEKADNVILTELFRQRETLDKEITRKLSSYKVDEAITLLDDNGRIKICNSPEITRSELVNDYMNQFCQLNNKTNEDAKDLSNIPKNETRVIIAYRNSEVKALNIEIRNRMLNSGLLLAKNYNQGGQEFEGSKAMLKIALNEQLVFTKNQRYLGVLNGQIGRVIEILDNSRFKVELLGSPNKKSKIILVDNKKFNQFDYGYAITSYKAQGKTYDYSHLLLDTSVGYEAFNVMATRHRISSVFYIDRGVLNDIVSRKFDSDKDISHQNNNLAGNEKAALFELLSKRNANVLAHDYKDYELKPEVIQIKAYLEVRDKASSVYRQLLKWQDEANANAHKDQKLELWDNKKLWSEFNSLKDERSQYAQELVEGYAVYRKYINASVINYATLLKHADAATIEFDYLSATKFVDSQRSFTQLDNDNHKFYKEAYNELLSHQDSYLKHPKNAKLEKLLGKVEELLTMQQEHECNLARLSSQIKTMENTKCELELERQSNIYYREDFKKFLSQTYKQGSKVALENWHELKQSMGLKDALAHIKDNPEILGAFVGMGWSNKIAVSEARSRAVFNLASLVNRLDSYEKAISREHELNSNIHQKESIELKVLNMTYNQLKESKILSPIQEKHLYELQEHSSDLHNWLKENNNYSKTTIAVKTSTPSEALDSERVNNKAYNIKSPELTYSEIHDKLSANVIELSKQLLPSIINKKIEVNNHSIECGSIRIALEAGKRGLWYRFSRIDEKGDLFDLIRVSQKLPNKQEAISWGKSYLGLDKDNHLNTQNNESHIKENNSPNHNKTNAAELEKTAKTERVSLKVLSPVPHDAPVLKPEMVFYKQLQNKNGNNKVIEGVYAYRNVKDELCGYVVRIKDIANDTKVTLPVVYTENSHGIRSWRSKGLGEERCLYNEHRLNNSNKPVLIVEGEKTADSAQSLYPEFDVITWSGGTNGFSKSNWNALEGKQVTIWPDNDKAGIDAAHKVQSLLNKQNITQAKIIDLSKIENLPEKWDLADNIPENVRHDQIIGSLYTANGIGKTTQIEETIKSYVEQRQEYFKEQLLNEKINTISLYIKEKEFIKYRLHYEERLVKEHLQSNNLLSNANKAFIDVDAKELVNTNIKSLSLSTDNKSEIISNQIQQDLAHIHQTIPKSVLVNATKIAIENSQQIINDHHQNEGSRITKADLPILTLALASEIIEHHSKTKNIEYVNAQHDVNNSNEDHLALVHSHTQSDINSINMIKNTFNTRIEQESHNFEQHQQQHQVIQRQITQHQGIEI